jgi:transcriptional regulator with XRE-family HTH domain
MSCLRFDPQALLRARLSQGLSRVELGRNAGVSRETIRHIEAGEFSPRSGTAKRLADALGVDPLSMYMAEESAA